MTTDTQPSVRDIYESMSWGPSPESDSMVRAWLSKNDARFGHFIDGEFVIPSGASYLDVMEPGTGSRIASVALADSADVDMAVRAARRAQPAWAALSGHERAKWLYALARNIQRHSRDLAVIESINNGKPIRESRDLDIPLVARHFYHHAGWAQLFESEFSGYGPLGVAAQIIPWNFPLLMLAWKVAPALAAGNTVVLKPAEFTPLSALMFAELVKKTGLPKGVFNLLAGDGSTGSALVSHPDVNKVAFTGSTDVGREIRVSTAGTGKALTLELGGKSPFIVFDSADSDSAVEGIVDAIWFNQGQVCCAGSRLLVQESVAESFLKSLRARMEKLRVGSPLDKSIDMGAIVAPVQLERIRSLVAKGVGEGASCWQPSWSEPDKGWFYPPTILTEVEPASELAQVEIFGPVLVVQTFRTPDEAVQLANNTRYGLAASLWTEDINLALEVAPRIKSGVVWINSTNLFDAAAGFGGYRESGFGREGGKEGMWSYVKPIPTQLVSQVADTNSSTTAHDTFLPVAAPIDRTPKLYIGGKQTRPDSGRSLEVRSASQDLLGEVGDGNRKDIRNAVEAAHAASSWARQSGHFRAQVLYYIAENLSARASEFRDRIVSGTGGSIDSAAKEVDASIGRLFTWAAWADKYDGAVHNVPHRAVSLAMHEPLGVVGVNCPEEFPLLGFVSAVFPLVAMGNTVVALPSASSPLPAIDFYSVLETSDMPGGVINIVTGDQGALSKVLAEHDDVDGLWYFGSREGAGQVERASVGNLKRIWANWEHRDWLDSRTGEGSEFMRNAVQVKNIWIPYGV